MNDLKDTAILLMHCPDRRGLVSNVTAFIDNNNGNVVDLDEHVDKQEKVFFMRIEWELDNFLIPKEKIADYFGTQIASKFDMKFNLYFSDKPARMALFVSKLPHCMYDILARVHTGEWNVEIPLIVSNHPELESVANQFGIPFHVFPITKENKAEQEKKEIELLKKHNISFVVLARYMQILSEDFIKEFPNKIINIHHSFLPAFPGAKPYHSAYERGVKIIGATSHYVTGDLDAGPILEQDITRITHKDTIQDLVNKGKDIEKIILSKAIKLHLQRKTLVYNNRTVILG